MTAAVSRAPTPSVRGAQFVVAVLLIVKLYLAIVGPPIGDEAYYWMWGQKLGWSYFDHPPLHAWLLRIVDMIFGWNLFSLRLLTWLTLGGTMWIFWLWSRRLRPEAPETWFWPTAALYLASPMFFWTSGISFHDHLLTFLCLASGSAFLVFADKWEATGKGYRWLYGAAALLGLAVLTKYNGALLGVGVALFFMLRKPLRPLWLKPHLYLAAIGSVAIQAPVIWWNVTQDFASYNFHLSERWGGHFTFQPQLALSFVALTFFLIGPFLYPGIFSFVRRPLGDAWADRARLLALCTLAISTLVMGFLSFFITIFFYWNIVAFIMVMPLLSGWMRWPRARLGHYVFGVLLSFVYSYHVTISPGGDWTISSTFGWPEVAARIEALEAEHDISFVAATRYTTAAQLGFAMHDADVVAIARRHDQYDYWFNPADHIGESALVVSDPSLGTDFVSRHFDSFTELETVPFELYGQVIYRPTIYLGTGFHIPLDE